MNKYSDYEVWDKYCEAQKEAERWLQEAKERDLILKPIVQWSALPTELLVGE